jgi:hypothetical protein
LQLGHDAIKTVPCRKFLKAMRARVDANGRSNWPGARA